MGIVRNILAIFILSLVLLESFFIIAASPASGGISAWPAKLTITMKDVFPEEEVSYKIQVNNLNPYDVDVSAKIDNPIPYRLKDGYEFMPDLSWIRVVPNKIHLSAKESTFLEIFMDVPDVEKSQHYNKRWEAWLIVSDMKNGSIGSTTIVTQLGIKLFIVTPEKAEMQISYGPILVFFIILIIVMAAVFVLYIKKEVPSNKKPSVFYFKKGKKEN